MKPRRSFLDWALEIVALAAALAAVGLAVFYWDQVPDQMPRRFGKAPDPAWFSPRTTLFVVVFMNLLAYLGLTAANHFGKLIHVPPDLDQHAPRLRPLLVSVALVMKTVLMLLSVYFVWSLVNA